MKKFMLFILFAFPFCSVAQDLVQISPNNSKIVIEGAKFAERGSVETEFLRMPETTLVALGATSGAKARTTTGVRIRFRTKSPTVQVNFQTVAGEENRGASFSLYIDGVWKRYFSFPSSSVAMTMVLQLPNNPTHAFARTYDIVLPSWCNPKLTGIDVESSYSLELVTPETKKIYVALGDSITHGVGQVPATYQTYPFLLAEKLGKITVDSPKFELYNLAVGGSKIQPKINDLLVGNNWPTIDVITYLIGYNDWQAGKSAAVYKYQLKNAVKAIQDNYPTTKIFLIRQTFTTATGDNAGGASIDDYRNAVTEVVNELNNTNGNIFVIKGEEIVNSIDLLAKKSNNVTDPVHLSPEGAEKLAEGLYNFIKPKL